MKGSICQAWFAVAALLMTPAAAGADEPRSGPALTLKAAIAEALRRSPQLERSQDAVDAAEIRRALASSRFSPKLTPTVNTATAPGTAAQRSFGVSVSQLLPSGAQVLGSSDVSRYGSGPATLRDAGFMIAISQPLLRGFGAGARAEVDAATQARDVAEHAAADTRQRLVVQVAHAFFAVVREQRLEAETARALERAVKLHELSEARASVGLATRLDGYRAGLLKSQAQASALRSRDALESAREDLNLQLGRRAGDDIVADADIDAIIDALPQPGPPPEAAPTTLEVADARARLGDARRNAAVARWNLLPNVTLDVQYVKRGLGGARGFELFNGWRAGFSTTHAFASGNESASAALAAMNVRAAEQALDDAEQRAVVAANRAARAVSRARETIVLHQTAVELAEQQRELAAMRYERGLADNLEVIDAENRLFQAQSARIGAGIDLALALLDLQRVSGTLDPGTVLQ